MKISFFVFMFSFAVMTMLNAQEHKNFKFGLGMGIALPTEYATDIFFTLEPRLRLNDDIALGFRFETVSREDLFSSETVNTSYTLNGQYYLSDQNSKPFLGMGIGLYEYDDLVGKFGFYPRVGFDAGHFCVSMDYNLIFLSDSDKLYQDDIRESYLGIRLGFFIGGGKIGDH